MKYSYIILILFFISCKFHGVCKRVIDGDTIVMDDNRRIRLAEIDAVEISQPYGPESKYFLSSLILNKDITVYTHGKDRYGRTIGEIYYNDEWINEKMVTSGFAVVYRRFGSAKLYNEELQAKDKKIGIWAGYVIPPFIWRRDHKH